MFSVIPNHTAAGQIDRKQVSFTGTEKRKWKVSVAKVFPETGCKVTAVGGGGKWWHDLQEMTGGRFCNIEIELKKKIIWCLLSWDF